MSRVIEAAGCLLWRRAPDGRGSLPDAYGAPGPHGTPAAHGSPDPHGAQAAHGTGEGIELVLVHRPKWADWSHPKGKLKRGEDARHAAVREVREETGMACVLGPELPTVHYCVEGRPKRVRYWAAQATTGAFAPTREVDRVLWLPPEAARERLTQDRDKDLVTALLSALRPAGRARSH